MSTTTIKRMKIYFLKIKIKNNILWLKTWVPFKEKKWIGKSDPQLKIEWFKIFEYEQILYEIYYEWEKLKKNGLISHIQKKKDCIWKYLQFLIFSRSFGMSENDLIFFRKILCVTEILRKFQSKKKKCTKFHKTEHLNKT